MTTKDELAQRYGAPSSRRRVVAYAVSALLAVVFLGWLGWAAFFHSTPTAESRVVGFDSDPEPHSIEATVHVELDGVDEAECLVRALSVDKAVVGELSFTGRQGQQVVTVRTERSATSVDMVGCRAEGQQRWR
ncbi:DUF4307 domain-containing protein [Nocardioides sp. Y6]|uniref:DUF4307 domain-containing protein n=1 Tax=Nocardioides malaquae TaxID=2773426 RepID=A0ABR9RQT7_9ACTN|nr:DUF4307 domain-containing protein [Nocardioides malaquae]MBE7323938.1 DUF4307 domain-containing protein [Nocardioides malaquae]